ncbi:MAG: LEA type 2 family protein [Myxococcota bacterium]
MSVAVFNPRSTPLGLKRVDYTLNGGTWLKKVTGSAFPEGLLEPGQAGEVEFTEPMAFAADKATYLATLERGTIPIELSGVVTFADDSTATFDRQGAIAAPSLPRLIVHDAQAARYDGGKGFEVTLFLRLVNENSFTVIVDELRYAVEIDGQQVKKGKDVGVRLVAGAVSEYEESALIDEEKFGRAGVRAVQANGKVNYRVKGAVDIRGFETPFEYSGEVVLAGRE